MKEACWKVYIKHFSLIRLKLGGEEETRNFFLRAKQLELCCHRNITPDEFINTLWSSKKSLDCVVGQGPKKGLNKIVYLDLCHLLTGAQSVFNANNWYSLALLCAL